MSKYQEDMYKYKAYEDCDYSSLEGVPLIHGDVNHPIRTNQSQYPGNRRTPMSNISVSAGSILIRTAGNALQAVPLSMLDNAPIPGAKPGDTLHVRSHYGSEEQLIAAIVPEGAYPGQSFYVQIPAVVRDEAVAPSESLPLTEFPEASNATAPTNDLIVVMGEDVSPSDINHDLRLYSATTETNRGGEIA
jgi:hypothetical protein